jgi:nicotinate dehydrogenase subunit B
MIDNSPSPSLTDNPNCDAWFDFSRDAKVLLRTGKVEIGQGILTALIQIAADELDIHPDRFEVLSGHTRLGPFEAPTSSSLSLEVTGRAIRLAASAVHHRLAEEAATLLQAQKSQVTFDDGTVSVDGRTTPLTVWSLAQTVSLDIPVLDYAAPKAVGARRVIGTSLPRTDLRAKISSAAFIQDIALDDMVHGRVAQPPSNTARIKRFDEARVMARMPGVRIIRNGSFVGVVADREELAVKACSEIHAAIEWDDGAPAPTDILEAIDATTANESISTASGDVLGAQGKRLSVKTHRAFFAHASIAPSCAIATWRDGHLEIYSHTQGPYTLRDAMGLVFDVEPAEQVTVIHRPSAGTYGHSGQDDVALDAALLAKEVPGTPVRVLWSRADDFCAAPLGVGMVVQGSVVLGDDGRLTAYSLQSNSQPHARRPGKEGAPGMTAAERLDPPLPSICCDDVPMARGGGADRNGTPLYDIPNVQVSKRIIKDLPVRTSALRGLGAPANVFTLEALMDDAARAAGTDPVKFRLRHLSDERAKAVISRAAEMSGWPGKTKDGEALGMGFAQYKNRSAYCAVVVRVVLDEDIRICDAWAAVDAGEVINPNGLENQVEGGIIQATSWTLKESIAFDGARPLVEGWGDYPILKFSEVPSITVDILDRTELPPLGAGETSVAPTVAAIGNAVCRALGTRISIIPITREAIVAVSL